MNFYTSPLSLKRSVGYHAGANRLHWHRESNCSSVIDEKHKAYGFRETVMEIQQASKNVGNE